MYSSYEKERVRAKSFGGVDGAGQIMKLMVVG
jgi:hypothetical protein